MGKGPGNVNLYAIMVFVDMHLICHNQYVSNNIEKHRAVAVAIVW